MKVKKTKPATTQPDTNAPHIVTVYHDEATGDMIPEEEELPGTAQEQPATFADAFRAAVARARCKPDTIGVYYFKGQELISYELTMAASPTK